MTTHNKQILFLHIPKTAGATLKSIINNQYQTDEIVDCYFKDPTQVKNTMEKAANKPTIKMIYGHFDLGIRQYLKRPHTFFTLLRDPVERVISFYYFIKSILGPPYQKKIQKMNLEEFLLSNEIPYMPPLFYNSQTADLSQDRPGLDKGGVILYFPDTPFPPRQSPNLEKAKENLEKYFSVVGITEMFDETLMMLKKEFGWKDLPYTNYNISTNRPKKSELPTSVLDLIIEKNQLDIQLYQWAKKRFEAKIQQLDEKDTQE